MLKSLQMHNAVWLTKIKAHSTQTKVATEAENHKHSSGTKLGNLTSRMTQRATLS